MAGIDAEERGTRLLAACWALAAASAILLFLRIYCKLWRGRGLWWDDHFLIISWVSLAIAVSINTYLVSLGFGRHMWTISDENKKTINLFTILVATFGILATTTSKTSFAVTLYRIATNQWMKYFLIFIIVTINISMNLVWIFGFAKCTPVERVWDKTVPGTCWDGQKLLKYQLFAAYYSAILDFVLAFLPWPILMGMSMRRRERLGVAVAMSLGAIAGICGIVKAVLVVSMSSTDITYDRVDLTIWTLTEPAASIMAVCIPVLRMLYRELKSSQKSYLRNRSHTNPLDGTNATNVASSNTKSKRYGPHSKYGRNSVVIMSAAGWQESQEALQDPTSTQTSRSRSSPSSGGVLKTEEVRVHHERLSTFSDENSIELKNMGHTASGTGPKGNAPSF
ncbi:hypothetical protein NCS57_00186600 [Fusarium keratoplasticum]|uniref:Uncharacterized protein n=1 Tax=Fusarium keratoplasticum TaxID=1328300 RepID=A0ACC0RHM7_9HYPO|nr:hypothetical protein NCS57_00186600 [Fusarium keratoplasticum]KAI8685180.1 hypothetical protein NCS57_00186600 [Fusarium keratoplasticum]KAI8689298.1 hypothetical protein NCS55_00186700 [Fusarium keratoplasticum]